MSRQTARQTEARQTWHGTANRGIESIPLTQAVLEQHVKRAVFQVGHVWGRTLDLIQEFQVQQSGDGICLPMDGNRNGQPYPKACNELIRCGCKRAEDCANAPRQTCPALPSAPAMAIAIKSEQNFPATLFCRPKTLDYVEIFVRIFCKNVTSNNPQEN